jgi:DNA polymerase-3 subunit epsilon
LFFDTETSGKTDFRAHFSEEHQPNLVQLAAIITDDDLIVRGQFSSIIQPNGWTIPDEAAAIHGITTEIANANGFSLRDVLTQFDAFYLRASRRVAHNIDFDDSVLRTAFYRIDGEFQDDTASFCTMHGMTDVCRLPGPYGFKWPKLSEAYKHAAGKDLVGAHDAMADVLGCIEVYRWMKTQGLTPCSKKAAA